MSFLRWAVVAVPLALLLGFLSWRSVPTGAANGWYQALGKPGFAPPDATFPVIWSVALASAGLALAIVLNARGARGRWSAVALFAVQFALGLIWAPLFFGAHHMGKALADLIAVLVLAGLTTFLFSRIRVGAALLMLPWLLWIAFASVLVYRVDQLNPDAETLVPGAHTSQVIG